MASVVIPPRFQGFQDIALGGYVAGLLAKGRPAEVRFLKPAPVGRPLELADQEDGATALRDGETALALARSSEVDLDVPAPVAPEEAAAATRAYPGFHRHLFPGCFVCGPGRAEGDGLWIFPGRVRDRDLVAALWTPHPTLAGDDGTLATEFVWSAVDCPSIWPVILAARSGSRERVVSARLALRQLAPIPVGEPVVVTGWAVGGDGRYRVSGAALHSAEGRPLALARHTLAAADWGVPLDPETWGLGPSHRT